MYESMEEGDVLNESGCRGQRVPLIRPLPNWPAPQLVRRHNRRQDLDKP